jgi:HEAT repeat protein
MADGPVLPAAFVAALTGAERPKQVRFTEQLLTALGKISAELLPALFEHRYADFIVDGVGSFSRLIEIAERAPSEEERAQVIDAIAEIIQRHYATQEVVAALGRWIERSKDERVVTGAARALALAKDDGFLEQQRQFLASSSPSEIRRSALLLGYGRYRRAVPLLLDLLRDDQLAVSDVVIWALGEIGDPAALPKLHRLLAAHLRVEPVIEALGKIGDPTSAVRLLPILIEGPTSQRDKAARAMASIARKSDGWLGDDALQGSVLLTLERAIDQDPSPAVRFWAIVGTSLLGGVLDPPRVLAALGGSLGPGEVDAVAGFFQKTAAPKKSPPKGRRPV